MLNIIIFIVGLLMALVGFSTIKEMDSKDMKKISKCIAVAGMAVLIFSFCFKIIPTGYTGIRVTFGQVDSSAVQNGFALKIPFFQSIVKINNKQQDIEFEGEIWSETSERTAVYYDGVTVTYRINPEWSSWIYANVSDYKKTLISDGIVASALKTCSKSLDSVDATNRGIIEPLAMQTLQNLLDEKYGENVVIIAKVIINNADFEETYNNAIAQKQNAQIEYERQMIENKKAAETAQAQAEVRLTQANAEAEAKLIEAEAEAKANEIVRLSLDELIFKDKFYGAWDGKLPSVVSDADVLTDVSGLIE